MTDETANGNGNGSAATPAPEGAPAQAPAVKMQILAQYIRDLSFENVLAQKGAQGEVAPEIQVQVSLDAKKRQAEHQYEVVQKYRVESKNKTGGETLFLIELDYGGVFHIEGVAQEQLHPFLMIECPRMLFPFVRRVISDISRDGGFPPVNLEAMDFMAIYRQELQRRVQQQKPDGAVAQ